MNSVLQNCYEKVPTDLEKYAYSKERDITNLPKKRKQSFPKRYIVTLLCLFGIFLWACMRGNVSVAIVDMTSKKNITVENKTMTIGPEFNWSSVEIGYTLSAYYVGLILSAFFGPFIHKIGGATIFGVGMLIPGIITVFSPFLIRFQFFLFIIARVIIGCFEGIAFVSVVHIFTFWSTPKERVTLVNIAHLGAHIGICLTYPLSGFLIHHYGWEFIFYALGSVTIIWCFIWLFYVSNYPSTDEFISEEEKYYLVRENKIVSNQKVIVPWKSISRSVPVYALLNECFISSFTISFFLSCLPLYVRDVYQVSIKDVGLISGIPEGCEIITLPSAALLADYLRTNVYTIGKVNKLYILWGQVFTIILFFIAALWSDLIGCIICICLSKIFFSFSDCAYYVIYIDMGGQFSSLLKAIGVSTRGISFFLNPILIGYMVPNHTREEWNYYFFFISVITIYGVIIFSVFGSGELQPWAKSLREKPQNETQNNEENCESKM